MLRDVRWSMAIWPDRAISAAKKPRESESRYFARLNTDPLTQPLGGVRHYADLVFLQLKALHAQFETEYTHLYLIPPTHYSREQRSLLLGISETAALPSPDSLSLGYSRPSPTNIPRVTMFFWISDIPLSLPNLFLKMGGRLGYCWASACHFGSRS